VQIPLQITFRCVPYSEAFSRHLRRRAEELDQLFHGMISCHVVVGLAGHHHFRGDRYRVSINVNLPGHELVVNHDPADRRHLETARVAADGAFDEMFRQLNDWVKRQRGSRHEESHGST
jgi:ribosome-associated translation inhibitor RaiA